MENKIGKASSKNIIPFIVTFSFLVIVAMFTIVNIKGMKIEENSAVEKNNLGSSSEVLENEETSVINNYSKGIFNRNYILSSNTTGTQIISEIIVHYVDIEGNALAEDSKFTKNVGETYITEAKVIAGYVCKDIPDNYTGIVTKKTQEVTYVYVYETVDIEAVKVWNDNNNVAGKRPDKVTLQIKDDKGSVIQEQDVSELNNWTYTFEVPKYDDLGNEISYHIDEKDIENKFYQKMLTNATTVTNTFEVPNENKNLEVTKIWNDNENVARKRPSSITLQIFDGENLITEEVIDEEKSWKHVFELPKYDELGNEINYIINEKSFANDNFYVKSIVGNTITNTFIVPADKVTIVGTKIWEDENNKAGKRPDSITLQVKENDTVIAEQVVNEASNWSYEFELAKYDSLGNEISYHIDEKDIENKFYKKELTNSKTVTNIFEVPNETVQVEAVKVWNDNNNESSKRPESIKLQVKSKNAVIEEFVVNDTNEWKHTFTLPKYDSLGDEIEYVVDEDFISEFYVKSVVGNTITNTFVVPEERVNIIGTKIWDDLDNFAGKRAKQVTLQLIGDNEVVSEQVVNADNSWSYEFEVPKYDRYGNEISYHIDEKDIGNKFYKKELTNATTVTNRFEVPDEKVNIEAMKVWNDNNNESGKRPTSIKLQIKRNGKIVKEFEVSESTNWKHTFELSKYDERGDEIEYTVDEDYSSEFYVKSIVGQVITNTFVTSEDKIRITGTKVWEDNGNVAGKREDTIVLQLKNEKDDIIAEQVISDRNNWSYEFEVPKYDSLGNEVIYHIDERNTNNKFYTKVLTDSKTVTNIFKVPDEKILIKAVKVWEDNNNYLGKRPNSVTLQIFNKDIKVAEQTVNELNQWSFEVELPKYDELGDEIVYTVDEKETDKSYEKKVEGTTVINRLVFDLPNTSDINITIYVIIGIVTIIILIVVIVLMKKNKK